MGEGRFFLVLFFALGLCVEFGECFWFGLYQEGRFIRWLENWGQSIGGSMECEVWG